MFVGDDWKGNGLFMKVEDDFRKLLALKWCIFLIQRILLRFLEKKLSVL